MYKKINFLEKNPTFWLILFINQRALYNHALYVVVGIGIVSVGITGIVVSTLKSTIGFFFCFLAHLVYQPKSLIQSCFVHRCHWPALAAVSSSVHTSPWHRVRHRNFILGTHMHIRLPYMQIKYLMILTCSF